MLIFNVYFSFEAMYKGGKSGAVTAVAFAPKEVFPGAGILAVGLESGIFEIWKIPIIVTSISVYTQPMLLKTFPTSLCHADVVRKLSWKPCDSSLESSSNQMLTLASCGLDHGVRIFEILLVDV